MRTVWWTTLLWTLHLSLTDHRRNLASPTVTRRAGEKPFIVQRVEPNPHSAERALNPSPRSAIHQERFDPNRS